MINITQEGAILLGTDLVCDGYYPGIKLRAQSHVHADHMCEFDRSKGEQTIYMSKESKDLVICNQNADIPYRTNIIGIDYDTKTKIDNLTLTLIDSGHMLGGAQIKVEYESGKSIGYSSDFSWPLDNVIKVDTLAIDTTCGGIYKYRNYSHIEATERFIELVFNQIKLSPVIIKTYRGTLQRIISDLYSEININLIPVLASKETIKEINVYRKYGFDFPPLICKDTVDGIEILNNEKKYIQLIRTGENIFGPSRKVIINASRYLDDPKNPVKKLSDNCYTVSLSGHADLDGTLEYIKSSGAKTVVTDNTRGGYAIELAEVIKSRLNINSYPSPNNY